nr:MAG: putative capsid protein [Arizlama virus]
MSYFGKRSYPDDPLDGRPAKRRMPMAYTRSTRQMGPGPVTPYTAAARRRRVQRSTINQRTSGFVGSAGDAKFVDVAAGNYVLDTTGTITHVSIVPTGTTVNSRDGKAFRATSLNVRGYMTNGATAATNHCVILYVWDRQPNKALAAITDVLDAASPIAQNKRENASRFVVIRRFDHILTGKSDGTTVSDYAANFDHYIKLPRDCVASCTAADTTGEIGNRITGALLQITIGNTAAGTAAATLSNSMRLNFVDV